MTRRRRYTLRLTEAERRAVLRALEEKAGAFAAGPTNWTDADQLRLSLVKARLEGAEPD